ncbi:MAG: hypothetical protein IKN17_01245 [Ruminococcus sp.]|nr:hypothetical protein [Ruminococcus sp.]
MSTYDPVNMLPKKTIHEPLISGGLGGSATTIEKTGQALYEVITEFPLDIA